MKRLLAVLLVVFATCCVDAAEPASALAGAADVATGGDFSCALNTSGAAFRWGLNSFGQLGDGTTTNSLTPVAVIGGHTFSSIATGHAHACAIDDAGDAWCWGRNTYGALGDSSTTDRSTPAAVAGGHTFSSITGGESMTCALDAGDAYCWGMGFYGAVGDGTAADRTSPTAVSGAHTFSQINAKSSHVCAVTTSNAAYCWGRNNDGQLGNGGTTQQDAPVAVSGGHLFSQISVGEDHTCAITTADDAYCWGHGGQGQLGNGGWSGSNTPDAVLGGLQFQFVATGRKASCGITMASLAYCWGSDSSGVLGTGGGGGTVSPVAMSLGYMWTDIDMSVGEFACGVTTGGGAFCWGDNDDGQLGDGTTSDHNTANVVFFIVDDGDSTIGAIVDPSLVFTVAGRATVCNGQSATNFQTGATGTAVGLGHISAATTGGGAQDVSLTTNAGNGFTVFLRTTGSTPNALRDGANSIADVSGTRASPGAAPVAGTAGFGYTSSDVLTAFTSDTWAKLTNTNDSVLLASGGTTSKSACVGYQVAVASTTPAGAYSATVVYTAVPSF